MANKVQKQIKDAQRNRDFKKRQHGRIQKQHKKKDREDHKYTSQKR